MEAKFIRDHNEDIATLTSKYISAEPFHHIVIDDFVGKETCVELEKLFPSLDSKEWINYTHVNEYKFGHRNLNDMPSALKETIHYFNSKSFVKWITQLTGIDNLISDPDLEGGGLHQTPSGGYLNIHADFTTHPHKEHWRRRVNLILYLNSEWKEEYGGSLEFWNHDMSKAVQRILPIIDRAVIFNTDENSFHGHPEPLAAPKGLTRKSIAIYYYTIEDKPLKRATNYKSRPDDSFVKSFLIKMDVWVLRLYNKMKRIFGWDDKFISKILALFSKKH